MVRNFSEKTLVLCLLLIMICLGACGGLTQSDKPAVTAWWLNPFTGVAQTENSGPVASVSVSVAVVPGLDTDQILTLSDDSELKPYAAARWVDNLPELTTSLVSRTLEASGSFEVVAERARAVHKKCDLRLELREFFAYLNSSGQTRSVQIAIHGSYQCESEALIPIQIKASVPVQDNRMRTIVAAFQQAMNNTMKDLLKTLHSGKET
jgi:ABC-type uncharacterized transport system auxiliary subunit